LKTLLTLDYELYFGSNMGSVEQCLIEPTRAILNVLKPFGAKAAFFVDAGYLRQLRRFAPVSPQLASDYSLVRRQLDELVESGHEIQLHVHPHWENCSWDGRRWEVDLKHYRLHDFPKDRILDIVRCYHAELEEIAGTGNVFAFRAGGWVCQPFGKIKEALRRVGIRIDSSVFSGGISDSATHWFDFRGAPADSNWRFSDDPLKPVADGEFLEVPIASFVLHPLFYWRYAAVKLLKLRGHVPYGNGRALPLGREDLKVKLLKRSASVVSIDGYKASFLTEAYRDYLRRGMDDFVVMGHPKALTSHSLEQLRKFLDLPSRGDFGLFRDYDANVPHR